MRPSPAKQLTVVLLVALFLRLGVAWWFDAHLDGRFAFGDSNGYWVLAAELAAGRPYQFGPEGQIYRTPGYPILLAPVFLIGGRHPPVLWGRIVSVFCGTLSVLGVWVLGRRLFVPAAGTAAAAVTAVYPGAIATSVLVLTEAPFGLMMLVHLILWTAAWQAQSAARAAGLALLAGLGGGAATLIRPSWLLFIPFAMAIGLTFGRPRVRHLAIGLAMLTGFVVIMAPWWIRNWAVCGHFVPTSLQVGASLYDGLNPDATGASDMRFVPPVTAAERLHPAGTGGDKDDLFEYRLNQRMRNEALAWAGRHPGRVAQLALVKLVRIWNLWPNERTLSNWIIRLIVAASYAPVMILALVGAWRTIRWGWPYVLCWLPAVYFTLLHMVFVGSVRYRQPAMLALIVLAAGAVFVRGRNQEVRT